MSNALLYTEEDQARATALRRRRRLLVILPSALLLVLAIASFVWFRLHRDISGWVWTGLLTVLAGGYFLFFYEVYLRPASLYKKHVDYMLSGRLRETTGILTSLDTVAKDKDGLDCFALTVNVGQTNSPEDERLFYLDALKGLPACEVGDTVAVYTNDRMVAGITNAPKER